MPEEEGMVNWLWRGLVLAKWMPLWEYTYLIAITIAITHRLYWRFESQAINDGSIVRSLTVLSLVSGQCNTVVERRHALFFCVPGIGFTPGAWILSQCFEDLKIVSC